MLGLYKEHSCFTHSKGHSQDDELHPFHVKKRLEISSFLFLDHVFSFSANEV